MSPHQLNIMDSVMTRLSTNGSRTRYVVKFQGKIISNLKGVTLFINKNGAKNSINRVLEKIFSSGFEYKYGPMPNGSDWSYYYVDKITSQVLTSGMYKKEFKEFCKAFWTQYLTMEEISF